MTFGNLPPVKPDRTWLLHLSLASLSFGGALGGLFMAGNQASLPGTDEYPDATATWSEGMGAALAIVCSISFAICTTLALQSFLFSTRNAVSHKNRVAFVFFLAIAFALIVIFSIVRLIRPLATYGPDPGQADVLQVFFGVAFMIAFTPLCFTFLFIAIRLARSPALASSAASFLDEESNEEVNNGNVQDPLISKQHSRFTPYQTSSSVAHNGPAIHKDSWAANRTSILALITVTVVVCFLTTVLTSVWNYDQPEYSELVSPYSILPNNGVINDSFSFKLYSDVVVYFTWVWAICCLGLFSHLNSKFRRFMHKRIVKGADVWYNPLSNTSYGEVLLSVAWFGLFVYWFYYWAFGYQRITDEAEGILLQKYARVLGHMTSFTLSFLVFPIAKNSSWEAVFGIPFERAIKFHRFLGALLYALLSGHAWLWFISWAQQGNLWNNLFVMGNLQVGPESMDPDFLHYDNFTMQIVIPVYILVTVMVILSFTHRRKNYELFYYVHHLSVVFFAAALIHAWSLWYYTASGLLLWLFDRCVRLARQTKDVTVLSAEFSSGAGVTRIHLPRSALPQDFQTGQYAYLHVPAISKLQWHPFTISSSPLDEKVVSFHVKDMGPGTWTRQLGQHVMALKNSAQPLKLSVEGPYGRCGYYAHNSTLVLVAGGIGFTPFNSILSDLNIRVRAGYSVGAIKRVHVVWAVQKDETMLALANTLYDADRILTSEDSPLRLTMELFSTQPNRILRRAEQASGAGMESAGISSNLGPQFKESASAQATEFVLGRLRRGRPPLTNIFAELAGYSSSGHAMALVCGPSPMVSSVSQLSHRYDFDFHAESFEF